MLSVDDYVATLARRNVPRIGQLANAKRHAAHLEARECVRDAIALWGGHRRAEGLPDSQAYRRFYFMFGHDVLTAQTLKRDDALALG